MKLTDLAETLMGKRYAGTEGENDLGFGTKITASGERLINRDGSFNIRRTGIRNWTPYMWLVEMPWPPFFGIVFLFYELTNAFFALLFVLAGVENLNGVSSSGFFSDFLQAFFFSIQTFTTVGYGFISPQGIPANLIASVVALIGLMSFAIATGLFFARFAKPRAQILFSRHALIAPFKDTGLPSFQFRIANRRNNKIIDLTAAVTVTWIEDQNGQKIRRFRVLELERDAVALFPLNWTIVHPIDQESPLAGQTPEQLEAMNAEFIVLIEGFDETFAQQVHASGSYTWREIKWNTRFQPMYHHGRGYTLLELDRIDEVTETPLPEK